MALSGRMRLLITVALLTLLVLLTALLQTAQASTMEIPDGSYGQHCRPGLQDGGGRGDAGTG